MSRRARNAASVRPVIPTANVGLAAFSFWRVARGAVRLVLIGLIFSVGHFALAEALTVATYNVENYVAADRMTDAGYRKDYPKPETQKTALRHVIAQLNADVLVLQEMGSKPYLDELQRDLRRVGVEYPHVALLDGPDEERHVAILSKRAFSAVLPHPRLEFPYFGGREIVKRGMLEVRFATSSGELTIFAVHLKSRFTDRADDPRSTLRRQGEATAVRDLIMTKFPDPAQSRFLILGDFNDDKSSKTMERLLHRGSTKISELVDVADTNGETWTHRYKKEDSYTRVDHILVSPGLRHALTGDRARILDGKDVRAASDHRPVIVTLDLDGKK